MSSHKDKNSKFATRAIHAGQAPDAGARAVMTPIYQNTTYAQSSPGEFIGDYDYGRTANPTRTAFESNIASLESGKHGFAFSSGCAALDAVLHLLKAGDHVVVCDDVYGGTFRLFDKIFAQLGIAYSMVDLASLDTIEAAIRPETKMVYIETPTNPLLKIVDIEAISGLAKSKNLLSVVDNTFATPYLQTPLLLGADIVLHSSTKYIGGHSDVLGGVLVTNDDELAEKIGFIQNAVGAVPSPFDCFLLLRSTKTLAVRMDRHCANAEKVVSFLSEHSSIEKVLYPGLESHVNHDVAKRQMSGFGGMISFVISGGLPKAKSFLENVSLFTLAESLGGVESLVEHPAIMTHASVPKEAREELGISDGLIRISVGIEDVDDQIADLSQALSA